MSTALTTEQAFQEKIQDRIRAAVGELMPDEVLQGLIAKGIEKAFFEYTEVPARYGYGNERIDPWFVKFVKAEMQERVNAGVCQWIKDNDDKVQAAMRKVIDEGVAQCVLRVFSDIAMGPMDSLRQKFSEITQRLQ